MESSHIRVVSLRAMHSIIQRTLKHLKLGDVLILANHVDEGRDALALVI